MKTFGINVLLILNGDQQKEEVYFTSFIDRKDLKMWNCGVFCLRVSYIDRYLIITSGYSIYGFKKNEVMTFVSSLQYTNCTGVSVYLSIYV